MAPAAPAVEVWRTLSLLPLIWALPQKALLGAGLEFHSEKFNVSLEQIPCCFILLCKQSNIPNCVSLLAPHPLTPAEAGSEFEMHHDSHVDL